MYNTSKYDNNNFSSFHRKKKKKKISFRHVIKLD